MAYETDPQSDVMSGVPQQGPGDYLKMMSVIGAMFPQMTQPGQMPSSFTDQGETPIPLGVYSQGANASNMQASAGGLYAAPIPRLNPMGGYLSRALERRALYNQVPRSRNMPASRGGAGSMGTAGSAGPFNFDPSMVDPTKANEMLGHYGFHLPEHINPFLMFNDQSGLGATHPHIARALEGALLGAANTGGANTWGEGISNVARSLMSIPQTYAANAQSQYMAPFAGAEAAQRLESGIVDADYKRAMAANAMDKTAEVNRHLEAQAQTAALNAQTAAQREATQAQSDALKYSPQAHAEQFVRDMTHQSLLQDKPVDPMQQLAWYNMAVNMTNPSDIAASTRAKATIATHSGTNSPQVKELDKQITSLEKDRAYYAGLTKSHGELRKLGLTPNDIQKYLTGIDSQLLTARGLRAKAAGLPIPGMAGKGGAPQKRAYQQGGHWYDADTHKQIQ